MESTALAFFVTECRGVKFYDFKRHHLEFGTQLSFRRNPFHPKDANYVEVLVNGKRRRGYKLGHVRAEAAEWLSTLLTGPFKVTVSTHNNFTKVVNGNMLFFF